MSARRRAGESASCRRSGSTHTPARRATTTRFTSIRTFARRTPFGGTIAHGMLVLALIGEMMRGAFGEAWFSTGRLKVRFKAPTRPGDDGDGVGDAREGERRHCRVRRAVREPGAARC